MEWRCKCGRRFSATSIVYPVFCACGRTDRGNGIVELPVDGAEKSAGRRYAEAIARWIAAGRPIRTDTQVDQILNQHCRQCQWFQDSRCHHEQCGCRVVEAKEETRTFAGLILPRAMLNKLRMATERCPVTKWQ